MFWFNLLLIIYILGVILAGELIIELQKKGIYYTNLDKLYICLGSWFSVLLFNDKV